MNEPVTIVEIDRDICSLSFGVAPCNATGTKCYNTWKTCKAPLAYAETTQTLRFVKPRADIPLSWDAIPSVQSTSTAPTELNVGDVDASSGPLGKRAQATVTFQDHPTSDIKLDPYVSERGVNPMTRGSFWTKLQARWPYHKGRKLRIYDGYINQAISAMVKREYLIDSIDGPDANGRVTLRAVDPLRILDDKTSQAPVQSRGSLSANMTAAQTTATITGAVLADYPATGTLRIDSELMTYSRTRPGAEAGGTVYNFDSTVEGWTASGASQSVSDSIVLLASTSSDPQWISPAISISGAAVRYIKLRIKRFAGSEWQGTVYYATGAHGNSESFKKQVTTDPTAGTSEFVDLVFDMHALTTGGDDWKTSTITSIRIDLGASSSDSFGIDWTMLGSEANITFTGITRGTDGTTAATHNSGTRVQTCIRVTDVNAWEVARDLIQTYAPAAYPFIDLTQWSTEATQWLDGFIVSSVISEPTGLNTLLAELCRDAQFFIWWDERQQKILLRAVRPPSAVPDLWTDEANIIAGTQAIQYKPAERISQVWYYYDPQDLSKSVSTEENYRKVRIRIDAASESEREYDEAAIRKIFSRWVRTDSIVTAITSRIINRYRENPFYLTLQVDAKDRATWTADVIDVSTRILSDFEGMPKQTRYQVISAEEVKPGAIIKYVLQNYNFTARYGYYMADDAQVFSAATEDQKLTGGWYGDVAGLVDGAAGYEYQ